MRWVLLMTVCWVGVNTEQSCPHHCYCYVDPDNFKSANCSSQALSNTAQSAIEILSLQPHIRGVQTNLFPRAFTAFPKVKFLSAVNCSILHIPNNVFYNLDLVIEIDLSFNKIQHLNGVVFKELRSLHTLILRGNPLRLTYWDSIVSNSLRKLDMGRCGLKKLPTGTFINAGSLTHLILDGNELHTLVHNEVPTGLRYLNLAHNRIINVPIEVFNSMIYLRKLDLSRNPINCTCSLLILQDWFSGQGVTFENQVICSTPSQYTGQRLSEINENELCLLEDTKRQRHTNDIKHYNDFKTHRKHNMILDQGFQSDQPHDTDVMDTEDIFVNEGLHGVTHMEMQKRYRNPADDLSIESNKLENSKKELIPSELEITNTDTSFHHETKDVETIKPEYLELTTTENEHKIENNTKQKNDHLDIMLSDIDDGSGTNPTDDLTTFSVTSKLPPSEKTPFTFPSTSSDLPEYSYDTQHDYSGEVGMVTESMKTTFGLEEGSGEPDNETTPYFPKTIGWMEEQENETSSEFPRIVDHSSVTIFNLTNNETNEEITILNEDIQTELNATDTTLTESNLKTTILEETNNTDSTTLSSEGIYTTDVVTNSFSTETSSTHTSSSTENTPTVAFPSSTVGIETTSESQTTIGTKETQKSFILPDVSTASVSSSSLPEETTSDPTTVEVTKIKDTTPVIEVEINSERSREAQGRIREPPSEADEEQEVGHQTLSYIVLGLLIVLIVVVILIIAYKKMTGNKKKVRLPRDTENNLGTEMQDMLLPKPPENGIKITPQNGTSNGKDVKEEEIPVLSKDWEEKTEPIETVTARMSILARPQTPVFIHKTLA